MARLAQSAKDRDLANLIRARYVSAAEARIPRVKAWDESYDRHDPNYIDETKIKKGVAKVKFPYCYRVTEQQTTLLMEATDAAARWVETQPTTPGFEDHAEGVSNWLDFQYRYKGADYFANNRTQHKRWAYMGGAYGNSYLYAQWDDRKGNVEWRNIDTYDVFLEPRNSKWIIVRRVVSLAELGRLAESISAPGEIERTDPETGETEVVAVPPRDGGRALKGFRRIKRDVEDGRRDSGWLLHRDSYGTSQDRRFKHRVSGDGERHSDDSMADTQLDPFNAMIVLLEYYECSDDGLIVRMVPNFDGDSVIMQAEQNPYECVPIVPFVPHPVDNEVYGRGTGEIVGKLADAMDYNLRASLSMIGAAGWPALLIRRSSQLRKKRIASLYGAILDTQDPQNDAAYLQMQLPGSIHQLGQQVAQQAADFGTGESDVRRGNVGSARSATAAAIAETSGNTTDRNIFSQWRDSNEQLAKVCLAIAKVHAKRSQIIPILGRHDGSFMEITSDAFEAQWAVTFGGNPRGTNATQQITTHLNIAQALAPLGTVNAAEVTREVYRLAGHSNPDRFVSLQSKVPVIPPDEEFRRLAEFGQRPVLAPDENVAEHEQAHREQLFGLAQTAGPGDPIYNALYAHWTATMQVLQQQQAAVAAPGGGSSGFDPSQVGQQGQPLTFQGATADIDGARNGSNVAAAGQAPGPTGAVPGRSVGGIVSSGGPR